MRFQDLKKDKTQHKQLNLSSTEYEVDIALDIKMTYDELLKLKDFDNHDYMILCKGEHKRK